jgi:hypothetical protein
MRDIFPRISLPLIGATGCALVNYKVIYKTAFGITAEIRKLRQIIRSEDGHIKQNARKSQLRHCERSEAIQLCVLNSGLLRRFAPRNDGVSSVSSQ